MNGIKAVFLDIDNTILDFDAYVKQALKAGFENYHLDGYTEAMYERFEVENKKVWDALEKGNLTFQELKKIRMQRFFDAVGIEMDGIMFEEFFRLYLKQSAIPVEGVEDLICYLSQKYTLFTASNGPYEQQVHRMQISGYSKYFQDHFISEDLGHSKPALGFFQAAFERMKAQGVDLKPSQIVMIGDSESSDMTGAHNAGIHTIWYNPQGVKRKASFPIDEEVKTLCEIQTIL